MRRQAADRRALVRPAHAHRCDIPKGGKESPLQVGRPRVLDVLPHQPADGQEPSEHLRVEGPAHEIRKRVRDGTSAIQDRGCLIRHGGRGFFEPGGSGGRALQLQ